MSPTLPACRHGRADHHRRRAAAPRHLREEPYWQALTRLMDWAEIGHNLHLVLLPGGACRGAAFRRHSAGGPCRKKISGVFASLRAIDDPLLAGLPARAATPHSRKNGLLESDLVAKDYRILSRLTDGSVDAFARDGPKPPRLLFRAIPNMAPRRWGANICAMSAVSSEAKAPRPAIPENYFDRVTENALAGACRRARLVSRTIARSCSAPYRCNPGAAIRSNCLPTGSPPSRRKNPAAARPGPPNPPDPAPARGLPNPHTCTARGVAQPGNLSAI